MNRKYHWTPEDDERLTAYANDGWSYEAAAAMIGNGVTRNMVAGRAWRQGIKFHGENPHTWTRADDKELLSLAASGFSARQIAAKLGRTKSSIQNRLNGRLGVSLAGLRDEKGLGKAV